MSADLPLPKCVTDSFRFATDDISHFVTRGKAYAQEIGDRIDRAVKRLGLRSHQDKRVTGVVNGTCIGVDLYRGQYFGPAVQKLTKLPVALVAVLCQSFQSSGETSVVCVLPEPPKTKQHFPQYVRCELFLCLSLAPLWEIDLQRPRSSTLIATDPSDAFGFGMSAATVNPIQVRRSGRTCGVSETMAVLGSDATDTPVKERPFRPVLFHLHKRRFIPHSCFVSSQV